MEDENGSVEVGLHKPGNIQIDNRKGDVQVTIPPNTPIKVEARTREGEIQSDFEEIKIESHERESSASGSIGTNGPKLVMNCDKGQIEIRKGTVATVAPVMPSSAIHATEPGQGVEGFAGSKGGAGGYGELGRAGLRC